MSGQLLLTSAATTSMSSMGGMRPVAFSWHAALTAWQAGPFSLATVLVLCAVAYWYLRADWRLAGRGRRWPARRTASFMLGLFSIDLAVQSPVATFTASYFQAHVLQHLLLMVVAPPLLALGAPSTLLLQTSSRRLKTVWLRVLKSRGFAVLTFPATVFCLYFGVMFAFFLTSLINTAMLNMWLMDVFNVVFFFGATLYWWPLVGLDPIVHWRMGYGTRMLSILLGGPPEVILGLAILSSSHPIASMYTLASTRAGGGMLWVATEASALIGFVPVFLQWARADERAAKRIDERRAATEENAGDLATVSVYTPPTPLNSDDDTWKAYWMTRTGSVPVAREWIPNAPQE